MGNTEKFNCENDFRSKEFNSFDARMKLYHGDCSNVLRTLIQNNVQVDAVITVPTKQLILNGISRSTEEDLSILSRGKISYKGIDYLIHHVVPKTLVADEWQMYDFICFIDKKEIP